MAETEMAHTDPVRGAVKVLMGACDVSQNEVALGAGIPKRTMIRRMQLGGWTVDEVNSLARYFGVPVTVFLEGPTALLTVQPSRAPYGPTNGEYCADGRVMYATAA